MSYTGKILNGGWSLLQGMWLTLKYITNPKTIITQQYPNNRETLKMFDRFRGRLVFVFDDESGKPKCIACNMCNTACPNASIELEGEKDPETKKRYPTKYVWHSGQCTYCGLCVEACPADAIRFTGQYENAVYDRAELDIDLLNSKDKG